MLKTLRPVIGKALKNMRVTARLSQTEVENLTTEANWAFQILTARRVSAIERGTMSLSMPNLISLLVLYSSDRATLNFARFQRFVEAAARSQEALTDLWVDPSPEPKVDRVMMKLVSLEERVGELEANYHKKAFESIREALDQI